MSKKKATKMNNESSIMRGLGKLKSIFSGSSSEEASAPKSVAKMAKKSRGAMPKMAMRSAMDDMDDGMDFCSAPKRDMATESYMNEAVKGISSTVRRK